MILAGYDKALIFTEKPIKVDQPSFTDHGRRRDGSRPERLFHVRTYTKKDGQWHLDDSNSRDLNGQALVDKLHSYLLNPRSLVPAFVQFAATGRSTGLYRERLTGLKKTLRNAKIQGLHSYISVVPFAKGECVNQDVKNRRFDLADLNLDYKRMKPCKNGDLILVNDSSVTSGSPFNVYDVDLTHLTKLFDLLDKLTTLMHARKQDAVPCAT